MSEFSVERASYSTDMAAQLGRLNVHLTDGAAGTSVPEDLLRVGTDSPYAVQLVARQREQIIGAASLTQLTGMNNYDAWLNDFVVAPDWRGSGVADAIRDGWNEWTRERGVQRLLFTSGWAKQAAHRFYLRHGGLILNPEGGKTAFFNMPIPGEPAEGEK
ncbi:GNAT family N-acetyltransferase [Candidatus Saccharibacteria bacterium]|nr:GNAT family N-acetyltransferase [Candidatus Saccharibacteria bacterium]